MNKMIDASQVGCKVSWDKMLLIKDSEHRFCNLCSQKIHDITNKSEKEIQTLKAEAKGKFCVKANVWQLNKPSQRSKFGQYPRLRKVGMIALLLFGNIISNDLFGQSQRKNYSKKIELNETISDKIIIKGKTKRFEKFAINKNLITEVKIYNQEGLIVKKVVTDKDGRFEFEIPKGILGNKFSISAEANGYKIAKMTTMEIENTKVKLVLDRGTKEQDVFYIGYM